LREEPDFVTATAVVAAGHALAGRMKEAEHAAAHLRQIDPGFRVSRFTSRILHRPEHLARWQDGLRKAGLPD
jgi:hypothetical protein